MSTGSSSASSCAMLNLARPGSVWPGRYVVVGVAREREVAGSQGQSDEVDPGPVDRVEQRTQSRRARASDSAPSAGGRRTRSARRRTRPSPGTACCRRRPRAPPTSTSWAAARTGSGRRRDASRHGSRSTRAGRPSGSSARAPGSARPASPAAGHGFFGAGFQAPASLGAGLWRRALLLVLLRGGAAWSPGRGWPGRPGRRSRAPAHRPAATAASSARTTRFGTREVTRGSKTAGGHPRWGKVPGGVLHQRQGRVRTWLTHPSKPREGSRTLHLFGRKVTINTTSPPAAALTRIGRSPHGRRNLGSTSGTRRRPSTAIGG